MYYIFCKKFQKISDFFFQYLIFIPKFGIFGINTKYFGTIELGIEIFSVFNSIEISVLKIFGIQ